MLEEFDPPKKFCSKCGIEKPATEEYFYIARPSGRHKTASFQSNCKLCWIEVNRENKLRRKLSILDQV